MPKNHTALTYEQIARKYDITVNRTQTIVKTAYNKIVKAMIEDEKMNVSIFDAVLALRQYFNMTEDEAVQKLNDVHKEMLKKYAAEHFKIETEEDVEDASNGLFKF
jgi:predicted DNA-binding protein (UPF0251 family)